MVVKVIRLVCWAAWKIRLVINIPALTGSDFEIVNNILWRLSLILAQAVPNRILSRELSLTYRSTSTIRWVVGDHTTTGDHVRTPPRTLSVIHKRLPKWPAVRAVWCWPWQDFRSIIEKYISKSSHKRSRQIAKICVGLDSLQLASIDVESPV